MDTWLLSSPLLYSLKYRTFFNCVGSGYGTLGELPKLTSILLQAPNLKILHIKTTQGVPSGVEVSKGPVQDLNLPLKPTDQFPPLHELKIAENNWYAYNFSSQHCSTWSQCQDWSQLRRLDLGYECPHHFLENLTGRIPNLKALRIGFDTAYKHWREGTTCSDPNLVYQFIESIDGLEDLSITNADRNDPNVLFPSILKHAGSLRRLVFTTPPHTGIRRQIDDPLRPHFWTPGQINQLRDFPDLEYLGIDVSVKDTQWVSHPSPPSSKDRSTQVAKFTSTSTPTVFDRTELSD